MIAGPRARMHPVLPAAALLVVAAVTVAIVRAEPDLALTGDSGAALAAELAGLGARGRGSDRHVARGRHLPRAARRRGARLAGRRVEHPRRRSRVHGGASPLCRVAAAAGGGGISRTGRAAARPAGRRTARRVVRHRRRAARASRPPPSSIPMPRAACSAPPTCCSSRTPQTWGTRSARRVSR